MRGRTSLRARRDAAQVRGGSRGVAALLALAATLSFSPCRATEFHFDCARTSQSVQVDVDTDRRFLQVVWSEGFAEEYANGESYISGPDSFGEKQKVTYVLEVSRNVVTFGADRACLQSGSKRKCEDQSIRNTLDLSSGELKYDEGDSIAIFHCAPAPKRSF
ncbi:MAG TPA: hypothetical protein VEH76_13635 [Methylocystis sp.]|nr:hypothetical protein [Methylocystis sp.]